MVVNKDGLIEKKSQTGFLYVDEVCLMASNEQDLQMIFDNIRGCISDYGIKLSEKKVNGGLYKWSEEREEMEF